MNKLYRLVWNENSPKVLVLALAGCGLALAGPPAPTQLPTGAQVVAGQATVTQPGAATLQINQSSQAAVINWQSFNLGIAASVHFAQPSAGSSTLNRVLDSNPSQIYGRITAPGQVFFTNPAGMYFGPGSSVEVGGLVATTHSISDADFMARNYQFARNGTSGSIVNAGELKASLGGYIALLAPEVRNQGVIVAQMGTVALAAGEWVMLQMLDTELSNVRVSPATIQTLVENASAVMAPGGLIILSAQAADRLQGSVVNSSGTLVANGLALRNGRVVLDAGAHGAVQVAGGISTRNDSGRGGDITLTGHSIALQGGAQLDASGTTGGGTVLVGGDWQGSGTLLQASNVSMERNASIDASATQSGDGGTVVLWSDVHANDGQTTASGSIRARGGALGGNGGRIETSGHQVDISGLRTNAGADHGRTGQWLLDPFDYTIDAAAATAINASLDADTSVTIDTANNTGPGITGAAAGAGDITVSSAIAKTAGTGSPTLSLSAGGNILLGADISASSGALPLTLNAGGSIGGSGNINTHAGLLTLNAAGSGVLSGVISGNGNLSVSGPGSVILSANNTNTGDATINLGSTLQLGNGGSTGYLGKINNNGTLIYNRSDDTTFAVILTNNATGNLVFAGSGLATLAGIGQISGGGSTLTINTGSRFQICDGIATACSLGPTNVVVNGELLFNIPASSPRTIGKTYSGSGTITLLGNSDITQRGSSTFSGTTSIAAGSKLALGDGSTGSMGAGPIVDNGQFFINLPGTTLANAISGSGSLTLGTSTSGVVNGGAGTTILTGSNSYGGSTTISAGTLQIGNGGATGTLGTGSVVDNAALVFNRAANTTLSNTISGSGTVDATITGDLTLNGTITQSNTVNLQATQALSVNANISSTGGTTLASGGNMALNANLSNSGSGAVTARAGDGSAASAATFTAAAVATITQSANANVELSTDGTGNLAPAKVLKTASGAGNIVLAAGKQIAAGTGSGGQVTPLSGNSVTNTGSGALYVYTGTIAGTGDLSQLSASLGTLNYNGTATGAVNTVFTSAYGSTIGSGPASQLLVRETPGALPAFSIALDNTNLGKTYGNADPSAANLRSALQSTYTGPATLTTSYGGKSFVLAAADVLADITASRAAGENVGSYAYSGWTNSAGLHTTVGNTPSVNLQIGQRDITLTSLSAANKTYDGNTAASITAGVFGNLANSESLGISGSATFADKNAATGKTVTVSDVTALTKTDGSGLWSNYHLSTTGSLTTSADINKKSVTLTASSVSKTYDGLLGYSTQAADLSTLSSQLGVGGDTVSAATIAYLDKNAGSGKTVALNSAVVSDGNSGNNYTVTLAGNASSSIAKASATVTGNSDSTRVYDGTTQTITGFSATGLVNGETASVLSGVSASGAGRNAGNYAVVPTGSDGNYHLSFVDGTLQINRAPLSAALTGSVQKPYDGLTGASNLVDGNFSINGWVAGEGATLTQTGGNYASKNVDANTGTGVVSTSLAANQFSAQAGTDLNNYVLPTTASGAVGRITPANLTVKVNNTATFVTLDPAAATDMGFSFSGLQNGESPASALSALSRSYSGSANPVAGSYSNVFGLATTPTAAHNNYTVSVVPGNLLVVPADQAIVNVSNSSATYGSLNATNAGASAQTVSVDYLAGGNTLAHLSMQSLGSGQWQASDGTAVMTFFTQVNSTGALSTGSYLNKGNYTYGIGPVTGAAAGNFAGVVVNGGVLTVDPLQVSLAASNVSKVYDGSTALPGSGTLSAANKLVGDTLTIGYSGGSFAGKNAGPQNYTLTGTSLGGADQANYALATINYSGTGSITPRSVTLSASGLSKTYDGGTAYTTTAQDLAQLTSQLGVSGDTVSTASAAFANANAGTGKTVSTSAAVVSDGNGGANYVLSYADSANDQILKKDVSLTGISASSKTYDGNTTASISAGTVVGTVGSETLSVSGTGSFADRNAGTGKVVTVADVATLSEVDGTGQWSNYRLVSSGSLRTAADIAKKSVTVSAASVNKTYDGTTDYTTQAADLSALSSQLGVSGDSVTAATLAYTDPNAGSSKTLTLTSVAISDGNGGDNYTLALADNHSSAIAQAGLTVSALDAIKAHDGAAYGGGNGVTYAGFVHGETQAVLDGMLAYSGNSQGAVSPGDYTLAAQGLSGRNYRLNFQPGTLRIVALPPPPPSPDFNGFGNTSNGGTGTDTGSGSNGVGTATNSNTGSLDNRPDAAADRSAVWMQVVRLSSEEGSGFTLVYVPTALKNAGQGFRFALPQALLGDDPAVSIQVSTQAGEPLPDWLHFDRAARVFIASSVPAGALPLRVRLVSARHQNVLQLLEASI